MVFLPIPLVAFVAAEMSAETSAPVATTTLGDVRGTLLGGGVRQWLGIPFAAAPRWAPPVDRRLPYAERPGAFDATAPGPNCPQFPGQIYDPNRTSEECLYIQGIWSPAGASQRTPAPVMVWIYGGGYAYGGGDSYNGSALAASQDVVVLTINYRLGLLGFLALADDVAANRATGNWGMLDQQAALRWVAREVGAFGGDSARVTIFGQSAGGDAVSKHLVRPRAAAPDRHARVTATRTRVTATRARVRVCTRHARVTATP